MRKGWQAKQNLSCIPPLEGAKNEHALKNQGY
ncbi:hypothetical protein Holit_03221 [Hollandina sp. SP2]